MATSKKRLKRDKPDRKLKTLNKLMGAWKLSGPEITGEVAFEWLEGGFFLVQRGWVEIWGRKIIFVEYIGYDEETGECCSHLFNNFGDNFTYVWEVARRDILIWFGKKDSGNCFRGRFTKDVTSYAGAWKWPGCGYEATAVKIH